jgi:hypothetical protein
MFCKVCNTRLSPGERNCPNCGNDAPAESAFVKATRPAPLPSSRLGESDTREIDVELELDDVTGEIESPPEPEASASAKPAPKPAAKPRPKQKAAAPARGSPGSAPLFAPDAAGLRALLAEQPDALEEGLSLYRDERGKEVGAGYASAVGTIDLLATDARGDLVVVLISEKGQGEELVAEVLQRVGWARKHLCDGDTRVRGIVLCETAPANLSYAAAAVADTVSFKTYRVALTFQDLEI